MEAATVHAEAHRHETPTEFLAALRREVERHPAVNHPLLVRVAHVPFTREDYGVLARQHYALVGMFTQYLERLLLTAPDSRAKQWIAKVLVDEYGEGSDGKDHAELYREFVAACGDLDALDNTPLHCAVTDFVEAHLRICANEPFLVGLGAIGPGHEWSIPKMFAYILRGLARAGFDNDEILYFRLHVLQDQDHGRWLEEALALYADTPVARAQIRRGALLSLEARARFWSGVQRKIVRWRQPANLHARTQSSREAYDERREVDLRAFRARLAALTKR